MTDRRETERAVSSPRLQDCICVVVAVFFEELRIVREDHKEHGELQAAAVMCVECGDGGT
jgi:hypothetical protein